MMDEELVTLKQEVLTLLTYHLDWDVVRSSIDSYTHPENLSQEYQDFLDTLESCYDGTFSGDLVKDLEVDLDRISRFYINLFLETRLPEILDPKDYLQRQIIKFKHKLALFIVADKHYSQWGFLKTCIDVYTQLLDELNSGKDLEFSSSQGEKVDFLKKSLKDLKGSSYLKDAPRIVKDLENSLRRLEDDYC